MYNYGRQTKRFTLLIFRSNKGASKQRRDQINGEISTMRDLLPLPESARQRLSQLQIMSLSCVFIRKCNVLQKMVKTSQNNTDAPCDFSQSLTGFLLLTTRDGKLLYISENVTEYLGHSMVSYLIIWSIIYSIYLLLRTVTSIDRWMLNIVLYHISVKLLSLN